MRIFYTIMPTDFILPQLVTPWYIGHEFCGILYLAPVTSPMPATALQHIRIHDKEFVIKISSDEIARRIAELALQINLDYEGKKPVFLGVLNGSFIFAADLLRLISLECEVAFIRLSSYHGTYSTGEVKSLLGLSHSITGRNIIILEDIVDTGETISYLVNELAGQKPSSMRVAALLFKPTALKTNVHPDYTGFEVEPDFLVGYGLDYDGYGRNLKDIYVLK